MKPSHRTQKKARTNNKWTGPRVVTRVAVPFAVALQLGWVTPQGDPVPASGDRSHTVRQRVAKYLTAPRVVALPPPSPFKEPKISLSLPVTMVSAVAEVADDLFAGNFSKALSAALAA